jgi:hypothetical protein
VPGGLAIPRPENGHLRVARSTSKCSATGAYMSSSSVVRPARCPPTRPPPLGVRPGQGRHAQRRCRARSPPQCVSPQGCRAALRRRSSVPRRRPIPSSTRGTGRRRREATRCTGTTCDRREVFVHPGSGRHEQKELFESSLRLEPPHARQRIILSASAKPSSRPRRAGPSKWCNPG